MPLLSRQRGPIAVYGATGYTGRLVAAELASAKADIVISGRDRGKLDALAAELERPASVKPASLDDPDSLRALLGDCAAVIDCAGPFALHGEPVVRAAVGTSTPYLDTTGEQPYMRMLFDSYGLEAERAEMAVIPAMGMDFAPGDMIASLTAQGMGEVDEVTIAYSLSGFSYGGGGATRGTLLSVMEILKGGDVEWRKLQWGPAPRSLAAGSFDFPEPIGRQRMARYPAGEQVTVPRHIATRRVRTLITASTVAPHPALAPVAGLLSRPAGVLVRTPARRLLQALVSRLPEGPTPDARKQSRWTIVCEVRRGRTVRRGRIEGADVYGLTGALVAKGAVIAARGGIPRAGALAPSQAFDPVSFLADLDRFAVSWELQDPREVDPADG